MFNINYLLAKALQTDQLRNAPQAQVRAQAEKASKKAAPRKEKR